MKTYYTKLLQYLTLFSLLVLVSCGGGGGSSAPAATYKASAYFNKTAVGNTWTLTGTTRSTGVVNTSETISDVNLNTAFANGVFTQTDTTITNGVAAAPTTSTTYIDTNGNLMSSTTTGVTTVLPATFSVGTTWQLAAATATSSVITGTIQGVGVLCSSPGGTFNDCIKVSASGSGSGTEVLSGTNYNYTYASTIIEYYSPTVGNAVEQSLSSNLTFTSGIVGNEIVTETESLQAGYIAN